MSADLVLLSAPADEDWLRQWKFLNGVWCTTSELDHDRHYRGDDGYLYEEGFEVGGKPVPQLTFAENREIRTRLGLDGEGSPGVSWCWIGQVSWLKADLMTLGGEEAAAQGKGNYVPGPVQRIAKLVDEAPILTPGLAKSILVAMNLPNRSIYGKRYYFVHTGDVYTDGSTQRVYRSLYRHKSAKRGDTYCGMARRQLVKRWLSEQVGRRIVSESW